MKRGRNVRYADTGESTCTNKRMNTRYSVRMEKFTALRFLYYHYRKYPRRCTARRARGIDNSLQRNFPTVRSEKRHVTRNSLRCVNNEPQYRLPDYKRTRIIELQMTGIPSATVQPRCVESRLPITKHSTLPCCLCCARWSRNRAAIKDRSSIRKFSKLFGGVLTESRYDR